MKQELKKYPKISAGQGRLRQWTTRPRRRQSPKACCRAYPNLKGIISPTTVGIAAAAAVLDTAKYRGKVHAHRLGHTPDEMKKYVLDGTVQGVRPLEPGRPRLPRGVRGCELRLRCHHERRRARASVAGKLGQVHGWA